ncbi:S-layer homology domain-containing protein [Paenibacillus dendritiformis]|uniref:S-layer homology domain-containing protein n=1 Tax=Paenibacillus dendritiformis TaxID=130049 RepID=UPI000DA7ACFE|nr:S-layer homology domain-containing protein [Paenibacillus dendritiformis]PZM65496.1 S-layer homology domain-containing protein [Paenibacillus dendritiformis]
MQSNDTQPKRKFHTLGSALLAVTLTLTSAPMAVLAAESGQTAQNQSASAGVSPMFSDVNLGFWAEKHIHKLAALDILKGNNGKFRPNDDVTQQEAITMAIRFMGLQGELNSSDSVALPADFKVGNIFKPYVVLAFQKGLIDKNEEMANPDPKNSWGEKKATREWITKILVRAVGKEEDAKQAKNKQTSFADNSKISSSAIGYVNTAVDLKLAAGLNGNKFDPQGKVTRAQLATFFSRGEKIADVKRENESIGYIMALTDKEVRLYGEDGQASTFRLDDKTLYYQADSEKAIKASDLALYTKVRVLGSGGAGAFVELLDSTPQVETSQATLKYAVGSENKLYVKRDGTADLSEIFYDSSTVLKDANGNSIQASQLTEDSVLEIKRETFTSDRKVIEIQVKSGPVNKSDKGTVVAVDATNRSITIKPESGSEETFTVAEDAVVRYKDQLMNGIKDLKPDSAISYVVKNSIVQSIELTQLTEMTVTGRLYEKGAAKTSLTIRKENDKLEAKMLAPNVEIIMEGINVPTFDDLVAGEFGDRVELTLNSDDLVTKIKVLDRKLETLIGVTVINYDRSNNLLTVMDANKVPYALKLTNETRFERNGDSVYIDDIVSELREGKKKANIQHTANQALLVQFVNKFEGTFISASTTAKTVTVKLDNGVPVTLPYKSSTLYVERFDKTSASVGDLRSGDYIVAYLTDDQTTVNSLALRTIEQFEVESVDTSRNRIRLRTSGSKVEEFSVGSTSFYDLDRKRIKLADIKPNEYLNVVMDGRNFVEASKVQVTYGRIESIDASSGVLMVRDNEGSASVHQLGKNPVIQVDDSSSTSSINALKTGDRVFVRKNADDLTTVNLITGTKRSFWRVSGDQLYVKRSLAESNYIFNMAPNVYVHSKGDKISLSTIKEDTEIMVYIVKNKVVEIERLS